MYFKCIYFWSDNKLIPGLCIFNDYL